MTQRQVRPPLPTRSSDAGGAEQAGVTGAVVVGLDGSAADTAVIDWAADEADRLGAPMLLVNAVDAMIQLMPYDVLATDQPSLKQGLEGSAHEILTAASARAHARHPGLDIAVTVPWGPAAAALVGLSDGAARVVVGGPARGRLDRALLGSVALPVVAHAHCPVAVVPAGARVATPTRIVVAVDGSQASGRAADLALTVAESCGASVTVVLAWNLEVHEGLVVTEPSSEHWRAVEERYAALGHATVDPIAARHASVDVTIAVHHGAPARAIAQAAAELGADLLVIGSRGRGGFRGLLLGSVSRRVVEHADLVVVIVH